MRTGVWLWLTAGLAITACSGDYPLEPTPCDRYCHATKDLQCDYYSPANCVVQCERSKRDEGACLPHLEAVIACFEQNPDVLDTACNAYGYYYTDGFGKCDPLFVELSVCDVRQFEGPAL